MTSYSALAFAAGDEDSLAVNSGESPEDNRYIVEHGDARSIDSLLTYAFKFRGRPYRSGASGPFAFDCSGFTSFVFGHFGYKLNRVSSAQTNHGVPVTKSQVEPGDLVFFKGHSSRSSRIGHVGIASKVNPDGSFSFIHASSSQGIIESNVDERYYAARYVTARRLIGPMARNAEPTPEVDVSEDADRYIASVLSGEKKSSDQTAASAKIHKVKSGENLTSIANQYGCTVADLKKWNNLRSTRLYRGQSLTVRVETSADEDDAVSAESAAALAEKQRYADELKELDKVEESGFHTVEKGETLYSLSVKFNCKVNDIKRWNNIQSSSINIGQKLKISGPAEDNSSSLNKTVPSSAPASVTVEKGETLYSISHKYGLSVTEIMELNDLDGTNIHPGDILKLK